MTRILFVFTSADKHLAGGQTGWWLAEAAHPYHVLSPHAEIDFASPKGANPPVDTYSVEVGKQDPISSKFYEDPIVKEKLANAKVLSEVDPSKYDAVFYPGGHGPVIDLATDPVNAKIASEFFRAGKVTAAVCHGPAALVGATDADGKSIFAGRRVNAFTNAEEENFKATSWVPFSVEDRIKELGGKFEKVEPNGVHAVVDGNLITGQNPSSATAVGEAIAKALKFV